MVTQWEIFIYNVMLYISFTWKLALHSLLLLKKRSQARPTIYFLEYHWGFELVHDKNWYKYDKNISTTAVTLVHFMKNYNIFFSLSLFPFIFQMKILRKVGIASIIYLFLGIKNCTLIKISFDVVLMIIFLFLNKVSTPVKMKKKKLKKLHPWKH